MSSLLLVALAGAAQAASLAWPFAFGLAPGAPVWWLQLLSLGVLAWQVERCRAHDGWRRAAWLGWLFAFTWLAGTFWWLFVSMHAYGGLPAVLAALAVAALAGALALYYAAACAAFVALAPASTTLSATVFASLWLLAELARGVWFTGFPWGAGGYAQVDALAVFASTVGVYGVGWIAAWLAYLVAGWQRQPFVARPWALVVLVIPVAVLIGLARQTWSTTAGQLGVTLLQGNIPQDEKFQGGSGIPLALQWYGEWLQAAHTALVVAPETAIPLLPQQLPDVYWAALQQRFMRPGPSGPQAALIGIPLESAGQGYTNSAVGFAPGQLAPYRYDKHHLVPFGEFIPPMFRWFIDMMHIPLGNFSRGAVGQPSFNVDGQRLAPNICYEDLFGEELGVRFVDTAAAPTIFVNMSNIGWFGNTVAVDQHLEISRMRALEFERPMIRATNTGATVIIDYRGHVTRALPRYTRGWLVGEVQGRDGITPYAWWVSRFGLWPLWGLALLTVAVALWRRRRAGGAPEGP
ncbi:MAG: apolipoprotein N-acyltransferase [Rhodoferax sp.]